MASLVRIKRRQSQEPAEALLLAAKRCRTDNGSDGVKIEQNVFKFCGSTDVGENYEAVAKLAEKGKQMSYRKNVKEVTKARAKPVPEPVVTNSEKKYKVLSAFRNLGDADIPIKVYDLVPECEFPSKEEKISCNGVPLVVEVSNPEEKVQYVYDFYYSDMGTFDDSYIDQLMSVQPYFYSAGEVSDSEHGEESDDSNDENNWRNDYPDTESDDDCDDDLIGKVTGMYVDDDDEGSSDEEGFVYAKYDDDERGQRSSYEDYKRRVTKELYGGNSESESSDSHTESEDHSDGNSRYDASSD